MIYPGGKNGAGLYQGIINLVPLHETWVEAFGGSAAVSRHLRPARRAYVLERDEGQAALLGDGLPHHTVRCCDALEWLEHEVGHDPATVVYLDPPYPIDERRTPRAYYRHELSPADHERLLAWMLRAPHRILVSGLPWGIYPETLEPAGWQRHEFRVGLRNGRAGTECVWTNYRDPYPLHDYRYWGRDKRVRQDVRRQLRRQVELYARLEPHRRALLIRALAERFGVL